MDAIGPCHSCGIKHVGRIQYIDNIEYSEKEATMSRLKAVSMIAIAGVSLSGCTATVTQASFFPDSQLAPPDAVLEAPRGYIATNQFFDLGELGKVRAIRLDKPDSDTAIIYHAGNGGFVDSEGTSRMVASLADLTGADIIVYDYPGRGGTTVPATVAAATAFGPELITQMKAVGWVGDGKFYSYGLSFGGAMAAAMVRAGGFAGLIIEGSAADYQAIGSDFVPAIARPFIRIRTDDELQQFAYLNYVVAARAPVLMLSGTKDKVIRPKRIKQFANQLEAQGVQVIFQSVPTGHGGALETEKGREALQSFMGVRTGTRSVAQ
jgi:pimeloyl-ACP methyl ester carboxylesterase